MQYLYQTHHVKTDTNGNSKWAIVLYGGRSWKTRDLRGRTVDAMQYLPVAIITGGHEMRDEFRQSAYGIFAELPNVTGPVPETNAPTLPHHRAFDLYGEPAHATIAQIQLRYDKLHATA